MVLDLQGGGKWVYGGVWKSKWVMWITKFNETWWIKVHGTFGAHEERGLLKAQLQIGPIF